MNISDIIKIIGNKVTKAERQCEYCGTSESVKPVYCSSYDGKGSIKYLCKACAIAEKIKKY